MKFVIDGEIITDVSESEMKKVYEYLRKERKEETGKINSVNIYLDIRKILQE